MTKEEYQFFNEAVSDFEGPWTDEAIANSQFANMPLQEAIDTRIEELKIFNQSLATAVNYMLNKN